MQYAINYNGTAFPLISEVNYYSECACVYPRNLNISQKFSSQSSPHPLSLMQCREGDSETAQPFLLYPVVDVGAPLPLIAQDVSHYLVKQTDVEAIRDLLKGSRRKIVVWRPARVWGRVGGMFEA